MDSENKFWLIICTAVCVVVGIMSYAIVADNMDDNRMLSSMIDKGFSPIEAKCAMMSPESLRINSTCLTLVIQNKDRKLSDGADGTDPY